MGVVELSGSKRLQSLSIINTIAFESPYQMAYNQFNDDGLNTSAQTSTPQPYGKPVQAQIPVGIPMNRIKYVYPEQGVTYLYPRPNPNASAPCPPQPNISMVAVSLPNFANGQAQPTKIICPKCSECVQTRIEKKPGFPAFAGCVVMTCLLPLFCWIPLVSGCCQDTKHFCPRCGVKVGKKYAAGCCE